MIKMIESLLLLELLDLCFEEFVCFSYIWFTMMMNNIRNNTEQYFRKLEFKN